MFQGFTDETVDFLWGIRFNNDREWFAENKPIFQRAVQTPMKELAEELYDWFAEVHPNLCVNMHISRIYRDARRLFGRGPFKDHMWFSFRTAEHSAGAPCFYFELAPEGWSYGMGFFAENAAVSERFRRFIDRDPQKMDALAAKYEKQTEFTLAGPSYARSKGHRGTRIEQWYNKKSWSLCADRPYDAVSNSRDLVEHLKRAFDALMPYFLYLDQVYKSAE